MARRALPVLVALAVVMPLAAAPDATAAAKKSSFVGVNVGGPILEAVPWLRNSVRTAAKRRAGAARVPIFWEKWQPYRSMDDVPEDVEHYFTNVRGRPTNFDLTDALVGSAAVKGISLLPVIVGTPAWASVDPTLLMVPPKKMRDYARYVEALARRYGPKGTYWKRNPYVPKRPIRTWQIWNEPAGYLGFGDQSFGWQLPGSSLPYYLDMLKLSRQALKKVDPGAKIVLAGFYGEPWRALQQLYDAGARNLFDVVTVHPYDERVEKVIDILRQVRQTMNFNGDAKKPMMVTEFGWFSTDGEVPDGFESMGYSEAGQAAILKQSYRALWAARKELRLKAAYWYTLATVNEGRFSSFEYAGLFRIRSDATLVPKPAAKAFGQIAKEIAGG